MGNKGRISISVLPLKSWMTYYVDDEDGIRENTLPPITPIVNRDGWYYDRKRKLEWYEYKGKAFIPRGNPSQFIYCLKLANAKVLTRREIEAYREMLRLPPPRAIRLALQDILRTDSEIKRLREIRLGGLRAYRRFNEEYR